MNDAYYISATGLRAQQQALDVIANNIANVNTFGFKRSEARFSELMSSQPSALGARPAAGDQALGGVGVDTTSRIFAEGDLKPTGKALDLAIQGDGFIELLGANGQDMLWRGGTLKVNADGYLASMAGLPLKAMISVPAGAADLTISSDGKVSATVDGQGSPTVLGQIDLVTVKDATSLTASSDGLYRLAAETDLASNAPGEEGAGTLVQGSLEASNVQLSDEMVTLMLMQRAFAANAQVVQASDQLMSIVNGLKR